MAKLRLAETGFEQKIADEKARKAEQRDKQVCVWLCLCVWLCGCVAVWPWLWPAGVL